MTVSVARLQDACISKNIEIRTNESMAQHTGFRTGGLSSLVIFPRSVEELCFALDTAENEKVPSYLLGFGSNTLFLDGFFEGAVIITKKMRDVSFENNIEKLHIGDKTTVRASCGASLTLLAGSCVSILPQDSELALSGLEFAYGIPGSVGGALAMNAGAYGGEMRDVVLSATCYDRKQGKILQLKMEELDLSYRHSIFSDSPELVILELELELTVTERQGVKLLMDKNMNARREKQPLEYPSAGSTFLRPEGRFVGQMTEECGLKGYTVGGAQLSEKHGGFVINRGGATSADILAVIDHIKKTVSEKYGIELVCEIKIIGNNNTEGM